MRKQHLVSWNPRSADPQDFSVFINTEKERPILQIDVRVATPEDCMDPDYCSVAEFDPMENLFDSLENRVSQTIRQDIGRGVVLEHSISKKKHAIKKGFQYLPVDGIKDRLQTPFDFSTLFWEVRKYPSPQVRYVTNTSDDREWHVGSNAGIDVQQDRLTAEMHAFQQAGLQHHEVNVYVTTRDVRLTTPYLPESNKSLPPENFKKRYGDAYVAEMGLGGALRIIFSCNTGDRGMSVDAMVESGILSGTLPRVHFGINGTRGSEGCSVTIQHRGGRSDILLGQASMVPGDIHAFRDKVKLWIASVAGQPEVISVTVQPLDHHPLPEAPSQPPLSTEQPNLADWW